MSVDPLAEKYPAWSPFAYTFNNPINFVDPSGMEGETSDEWIKKGDSYVWDDRVIDQKTATKYHGDETQYIGVNKTVSTKENGETVDSVTLNDDGTVTKDGITLNVNSSKTFTNEYGSTFKPKQTAGGYSQFSAGFAFMGGFGIAFGEIYDAVGDSKFYFTFDGNIGYGAGANFEGGIVTPTGVNQFLADDFGGRSGSYNIGYSVFSGHTGGSVKENWHATDKMNYNKFGVMDRGYRTIQGGVGRGVGMSVGGMFSYGTTKVF